MGTLKTHVRNLVENVIRREIYRFGPKSFAFIDKRRRRDAWFSYRAQLRSIIEGAGVDLVIDVGANEGQFGRGLRGFYSGELVSFEPGTAAFEKLSAAAASDPGWRVHKLALGSRQAAHALHVSNTTKFSSFLQTTAFCAARFGDEAAAATEEVVNVRRLEDVLNETHPEVGRRRVFLKMDTQGHDLEVFKGVGSRLRDVVVLQSEVSLIPLYDQMTHWTESIATYERAGFGVVGLFPICRDSASRVIEYDCLLLRTDAGIP